MEYFNHFEVKDSRGTWSVCKTSWYNSTMELKEWSELYVNLKKNKRGRAIHELNCHLMDWYNSNIIIIDSSGVKISTHQNYLASYGGYVSENPINQGIDNTDMYMYIWLIQG